MMQQQPSALKRSSKIEFNNANAAALLRERSFVKTAGQMKRRSQTLASLKANPNKPTMEIYRPPNVRSDTVPNKLNVHAKEFTMNLQQSKSSGNVHHYLYHSDIPVQHSKSHVQLNRPQALPLMLPAIPLMHSATSILVPRVTYQQPISYQPMMQPHNTPNVSGYLKRSKSMIEPPKKQNFLVAKSSPEKDEVDLSIFQENERKTIATALLDPNVLPSRTLMDIVKVVLEKVVEGMPNPEYCAKICMRIIEKENAHTFLESLLNNCQQWYQEREKILRRVLAGEGTRFTAFMWFLAEMCAQSKRYQAKNQYEELRPATVFLNLLSKCCMACVTLPITCLEETECLFLILTSMGRVLENEQPAELEELMGSVRDAFLSNAGSPAVRRTLLQLIELHASNWQLPGSSVLYYYPRIK